MKTILAISFILTSAISGYAQSKIDSLVAKIHNKQLMIGCINTQATLIETSVEVSALIGTGKIVTSHITPFLTDPEKGIIAHYILVRIWKEKKYKPVKNSFDNNKKIRIDFHGLTFYSENGNEFYALTTDLETNRVNWLNFLPNRYR
jgi:hypothetical protein